MARYISKGFIEADGVTIIESSSIELNLDNNSDDVNTIIEDYAGHTTGSGKYTVKVQNPVPTDGFEVDWFELAESGETGQLRFVLINPDTGAVAFSRLLEGDWRNPSVSLAGGKGAQGSVEFHGKRVST